MLNANNNNINNINKVTQGHISDPQLNINWLLYASVNNSLELSTQYAHICLQHKQEKKWVLFINPEESSIEQLAKTHGIDVTKVLVVNFKNTVTVDTEMHLNRVKSVLSKGNCSAVILSNTNFKNEEIIQLENSACEGKTQCVLLKTRVLH